MDAEWVPHYEALGQVVRHYRGWHGPCARLLLSPRSEADACRVEARACNTEVNVCRRDTEHGRIRGDVLPHRPTFFCSGCETRGARAKSEAAPPHSELVAGLGARLQSVADLQRWLRSEDEVLERARAAHAEDLRRGAQWGPAPPHDCALGASGPSPPAPPVRPRVSLQLAPLLGLQRFPSALAGDGPTPRSRRRRQQPPAAVRPAAGAHRAVARLERGSGLSVAQAFAEVRALFWSAVGLLATAGTVSGGWHAVSLVVLALRRCPHVDDSGVALRRGITSCAER